MPHYGIVAIISSSSPSTIFLSVELLPTKSNPIVVHPSLSMCFVSQLEMFQHLIPRVDLECSIFEEIVSYRFSFCRHHVGWRSRKQGRQDQLEQWTNIFEKGNWIDKFVLASVPSVFLPHVLNLGMRFLFSGGELSQPQISPCLTLLDHHVIMFEFLRNLKWGCWNPSTKWIQISSNKIIFNDPKMPFENVHDF